MTKQKTAKKKTTKKKTAKKSAAKKKSTKRPGLWANIHSKHKRIEAGSGESMRKKGEKGAPTEKAIRKSAASSARKKASR